MAGSTAPAITSSLLAWPSRPQNRSPLSVSDISTFPASSSYPSLLSHESEGSADTSHSAMSSSTTLRDTSVASWKGKGRASSSFYADGEGEDEDELRRPRYPPPKKPLSPRQLGRIAQSFGIVIPSLPMPSPLSSPNPGVSTPPSRSRANPSHASPNIVHSPYLLTVIPPLSLLAVKGGSAEEAEKRTKRWKRGRLVPLQPTLGGMQLAIAREFGLPSTRGLNVYLSHRDDRSSSSSNSSFSSSPPFDEASGPQISSQTWSTLYGSYLVNSLSRSSTPSSTPLRSAGPLGKDIAFPASPLSLLSKVNRDLPLSTPLKPAHSLPIGNGFPPTPQSVTTATTSRSAVPNPIIGTIEFDIDEDLAGWYDDFRKSGHRRKLSSLSDGGASATGIRELRLVRNANKAREKRQLQEIDANLPRSAGNSPYSAPGRRSVSAAEAMAMFSQVKAAPRAAQSLSSSLNAPHPTMSHAGSMGELTDGDTTMGSIAPDMETLGEPSRSESDELLASPIELDVDEAEAAAGPRLSQQEIVERIQAELEKRGSAMVMSDQLDDLERIMRSLSPREIRLTSPRMLTPRMAAKVANLQFPPNPTMKARSSAAINKSPLASSFNAETVADPAPIPDVPRQDGDLPAWPAVPFVKLPNHASPGSPGSLEGYMRDPRQTDRSPISEETLSRMKEMAPPSPPPKETGEWKPRRPVRPPSPNLGPTKIIPHALDPEMLDNLRTTPKEEEAHQRVRRSPSISLKSFRSIGGKKKREEPALPPSPAPPAGSEHRPFRGETVGLWKGSVSPSSSTFPGLTRASGASASASAGAGVGGVGAYAHTTEFGAIDETHTHAPAFSNGQGQGQAIPGQTSASLPVSGKTSDGPSAKGLGRFFGSGWGRRPSESPKLSSGHGQGHGHRKANSSIDGTGAGEIHAQVISPPIPDSFIHHQAPIGSSGANAAGGGTYGIPTSESSATGWGIAGVGANANNSGNGHRKTPTVSSFAESYAPRASTDVASPRSVRRKPVPVPGQPGIPGSASVDLGSASVKGSMSMSSVNSFVLEDAPKNRVPKGKPLI